MRLFGLEIRRTRSPAEPRSDLGTVEGSLDVLRRRIAALEEDEAARELRMGKLAGEIKRHFARIQEIDRRAELRAAGDDDDDSWAERELARRRAAAAGGA